jgi:repressor LexA
MEVDPSYLTKLQDYFARHQVIPSYSTIGRLWGISAKSWVANCVGRLKDAGFL